MYHSNGASIGSDPPNQLTDFRRGTLLDSNSMWDTITTAIRAQEWTFDALGNFATQVSDGVTESRTHNKQNQITGIDNLTTPTYDANGNTTNVETGTTPEYGVWNRLVRVKSVSTTLASFQYDALNRRTVENTGTARDLYYSTGWQVLEERVSGTPTTQYVWGAGYPDEMAGEERHHEKYQSGDSGSLGSPIATEYGK